MNHHVISPDTWTAAFAGGLLMGVIHVVTGADHLSAVATLSCGNDRYAATVLGVRWGLGHCVGLLVVFLAVLAATEEIDRASVRGVEKHMGIVVGLLMFGLGAYGLWDARRSVGDGGGHGGDATDDGHAPSRRYGALDDPERGDGVKRALFRDPDDENEKEEAGASKGGGEGEGAARRDGAWRSAGAVAIGVVHGAAGPGAILGVLPAVALRRTELVFGYFAGFCVATVATMGAFAASYGEVTSRLGAAHGSRVRFILSNVSAGACLAVGAAWIALSASGRGAEPEAT